MISKVFHYVSSFFTPYYPRENAPLKRLREQSEECECIGLHFHSPKKRRRLQDITMDGSNVPQSKSVESQTDDVICVGAVPRIPRRSLSYYTQSNTKENWGSPVKPPKFVPSPTKEGLAKYKAPAHCRSPVKVKLNPQPSSSDDVQFVAVLKPSTSNASMNRKSTPVPKIRGRLSGIRKENSIRTKSTMPFSRTKSFDIVGKQVYSHLLGSFLKNGLEVRKPQLASSNLTRNLREELDNFVKLYKPDLPDCIDLTGTLRAEQNKVIKPITKISLVDDDDDDDVIEVLPTAPPVKPVNSMETKIQKVPCTSPEWIDKMVADYKSKMTVLEADKQSAIRSTNVLHNGIAANLDEWLQQRVKKYLTLTNIPMPISEDVPFPELTTEMLTMVKAALIPQPENEVMVDDRFTCKIRRRDLRTLKGLNWLNDEVINFYMNLIVERGTELDNLPSVYCFNTFFYMKLLQAGHSSVKRWTKKVDLFAKELIIVPVHLQVHWCLACIDLKNKTIKYYDSMNSPNDKCLNVLMNYLVEEYKDKKNGAYNTDGWVLENVKDIPQQMNGCDCGMFACTFAEHLARRVRFNFTQEDMPYLRQKMVYEIITGRLMLN